MLGRVAAIVAHDSQYSRMAPRGDWWARRGLRAGLGPAAHDFQYRKERLLVISWVGRGPCGSGRPEWAKISPKAPVSVLEIMYSRIWPVFTRVQWNSFVYAVLHVPE